MGVVQNWKNYEMWAKKKNSYKDFIPLETEIERGGNR